MATQALTSSAPEPDEQEQRPGINDNPTNLFNPSTHTTASPSSSYSSLSRQVEGLLTRQQTDNTDGPSSAPAPPLPPRHARYPSQNRRRSSQSQANTTSSSHSHSHSSNSISNRRAAFLFLLNSPSVDFSLELRQQDDDDASRRLPPPPLHPAKREPSQFNFPKSRYPTPQRIATHPQSQSQTQPSQPQQPPTSDQKNADPTSHHPPSAPHASSHQRENPGRSVLTDSTTNTRADSYAGVPGDKHPNDSGGSTLRREPSFLKRQARKRGALVKGVVIKAGRGLKRACKYAWRSRGQGGGGGNWGSDNGLGRGSWGRTGV
ncbi:MAG: hypothetical protein M1831_002874 [Alyxoria varia]|nr:MAG: hypothetical protein M1831_002874 [Alyxoria varia]